MQERGTEELAELWRRGSWVVGEQVERAVSRRRGGNEEGKMQLCKCNRADQREVWLTPTRPIEVHHTPLIVYLLCSSSDNGEGIEEE